MATEAMTSLHSITSLPTSFLVAIVPLLLIAIVFAGTRIWTTVAYYRALSVFKALPTSGQIVVEPPQIPYSIPWLGNSLSFVDPHPGRFWTKLFKWHSRSTGVLTLLIGGCKTHILFSPTAIQALYKARSPNRDSMERDLYSKVFAMPDDQVTLLLGEHAKHFQTKLNAQYLTNFDRVNELTLHFTRVLDNVLQSDADSLDKIGRMGIYEWLRDRMFTASVTALMGEKLLERYPSFSADFFQFDGDFLEFFFSKPNILMRPAINRRTRMFRNMEAWSLEMHRLSGGTPVDPENGPAWEPIFGSRLNRARQSDYAAQKLDHRTGACLDAGLIFGLASNVIPATGWMLFSILDPARPGLYSRVLKEIQSAENADGSIDIPTLVSRPLLQSIWVESLRLRSDILVARTLTEDLLLPLDVDGKVQVLMRKGDNCFIPSWIAQHDPSWSSLGSVKSPADEFDPDRFLVTNPKTGEQNFSMSGTAGLFFPFGGGKTICPGRIFAKQEALGALAMILLRFEFDVHGFIDAKGRLGSSFPGFKSVYPGTGALVPDGDMSVTIRRRL